MVPGPVGAGPGVRRGEISVSRTWLDAEGARHELDAFLHPKWYAKKGHRAEALYRFRRRAKASEPEQRSLAHRAPPAPEPGTRTPPQEAGSRDLALLIAGPVVRRREGMERPRSEADSFAGGEG